MDTIYDIILRENVCSMCTQKCVYLSFTPPIFPQNISCARATMIYNLEGENQTENK